MSAVNVKTSLTHRLLKSALKPAGHITAELRNHSAQIDIGKVLEDLLLYYRLIDQHPIFQPASRLRLPCAGSLLRRNALRTPLTNGIMVLTMVLTSRDQGGKARLHAAIESLLSKIAV